MENQLAIQSNSEIIQKLVLDGDLSKMSGEQKVSYFKSFCDSLGLNPLTQPFQLINFQGKQRLYATKDCTEQLRKLHGVSITDVTSERLEDVFIVTAKAKDKEGKTDCSTGAVNINGLKGEQLANALMKAETKAKRRVTLSICGLGILDEAETDTMPGATTSPIQTDPEQLDPIERQVRTKYDSIDDIEMVLGSCEVLNQVTNLYHMNSKLVEDNPGLKQKFTNRKNELRKVAA